MRMPIIRLEIESMKETIFHAFQERQFCLDEQIQAALDKYLSQQNIQQIIDESVCRAISSIVKSESEHFFTYGDGAEAIRQSIRESLRKGVEE